MNKTEVYILKELFREGEFNVSNRTQASVADKLAGLGIVNDSSREIIDNDGKPVYFRTLTPVK